MILGVPSSPDITVIVWFCDFPLTINHSSHVDGWTLWFLWCKPATSETSSTAWCKPGEHLNCPVQTDPRLLCPQLKLGGPCPTWILTSLMFHRALNKPQGGIFPAFLMVLLQHWTSVKESKMLYLKHPWRKSCVSDELPQFPVCWTAVHWMGLRGNFWDIFVYLSWKPGSLT